MGCGSACTFQHKQKAAWLWRLAALPQPFSILEWLGALKMPLKFRKVYSLPRKGTRMARKRDDNWLSENYFVLVSDFSRWLLIRYQAHLPLWTTDGSMKIKKTAKNCNRALIASLLGVCRPKAQLLMMFLDTVASFRPHFWLHICKSFLREVPSKSHHARNSSTSLWKSCNIHTHKYINKYIDEQINACKEKYIYKNTYTSMSTYQ